MRTFEPGSAALARPINPLTGRREPRPECTRCGRPTVVCWCAHVRPIATRTRVVILQHPRERWKPIGTARMAALSLVNSELHVGVDFDGRPAVEQAVRRPEAPAVLLYPGPTAVLIDRLELPLPWTLVVVDGTWSQSRKIVHVNRLLQGLPRVSFVPPAPSDYRIRPQPRPEYVCTIEALYYALGTLEGDRVDLRPLLAPFRAMVDMQLEHRRRRLGLADTGTLNA